MPLDAALEAIRSRAASERDKGSAFERLVQRTKNDRASGIIDDPNGWHEWAEEPFNLIRHLRRLVTVSVETARTVANLPPALTAPSAIDTDAALNSVTRSQFKHPVISID